MDAGLAECAPSSGQSHSIAVLDTSIQIDRCKSASRLSNIESLLSNFDQTLATGIGLVEFKAVLIQQLITIYNQMRRKGAGFTQVRDALLEKQHPQAKLRSHIFNNLVEIYGSSFRMKPGEDEKLAKKCCLRLEDVIMQLYRWFREDSATVFWNDHGVRCDRANEKPRKEKVAFTPNLPNCVRGKNKNCRVESVVRERWPALRAKLQLDEGNDQHAQLLKASALLNEVCDKPDRQMSVDDCRCAGDSLIVLETGGVATHAISTNARDWSVLCNSCEIEFVSVRYPDETTR